MFGCTQCIPYTTFYHANSHQRYITPKNPVPFSVKTTKNFLKKLIKSWYIPIKLLKIQNKSEIMYTLGSNLSLADTRTSPFPFNVRGLIKIPRIFKGSETISNLL